MLQTVASAGSFAAAARALNLVPSALTYRVRQIEEALDVLLFDRSSRQARLTEAGTELLRQGGQLLQSLDAIANRVKRVATGWEPQFTIALDSVLAQSVIMELADDFFALNPPTQLQIRIEVLSGTFDALTSGRADLALGLALEPGNHPGIRSRPLGAVSFVFAVAPHHPLAKVTVPLDDELVAKYRVVAVADSTQRSNPISVGILAGQDVFTVASMSAKLDAQLRGLGIGLLPEPMARPYVESGRLVACLTQRPSREERMHYAWRHNPHPGRALAWWLERLESPATRAALLHKAS